MLEQKLKQCAGMDMRRGGLDLRRGRLQSESATSAPPLLLPTPEASSPTGGAGRRVLVMRAGSAVALRCVLTDTLDTVFCAERQPTNACVWRSSSGCR